MKPLFIERNIVGKIVWLLIKMAFIVLFHCCLPYSHAFMLSAFVKQVFIQKLLTHLEII